ncbi:MAG TPA: NAD(P)H-binding protein [Puia sp.]|jgi:putative NADH-flavin reductase|nr:NAD(P)H-binding protein [Puia sp.]
MEKIQPTRPLNILLFGANGGIGRQCVNQALAEGHYVTAIVRDPAKLPLSHPNLKIVKADVTMASSFSNVLEAQQLVISTIGGGEGFGSDKPTTLYSKGAENILRAMEKAGTRRAFFISAAAVETSPAIPWFYQLVSKYVIQRLLKHSYADLLRMETIIRSSGTDWTIVRPPQLTDKALSADYRFAVNTHHWWFMHKHPL